MKLHYTIILSILFLSTSSAQSEWQEFLSHERSLISANGHLLINDTLHIAYNDGLKKITDNKKPESLLTHYPYMYQRIKTTRTGIDSKELLLLEAFDYDVSGLGLVSFRNENGLFWGKEQFGYDEFHTDFRVVPDGIISPSTQILDQAIDHNNDLGKLNNGIVETTSPSPVDGFHEGLDNNFFAVIGNSLFSYTDSTMSFVFHLGAHKRLMNDPYNNCLVIETENELQWYSFNDFTLIKTLAIKPNSIGIQFIEDGLYQLARTDTEYVIYKYPTSETPAFEILYTLAFEDENSFNILSFEVSGNHIYFIGINNTNGNIDGINYHYAQRRTIGQTFVPIRQDLAIDTFSMIELDHIYERAAYSITVRNNGSEDINSFSISSPTLPVFNDTYSFVRKHFDQHIGPGETFSYTDSIYMPTIPSQISIKITGVNYGYDLNNDNDEYTTDVITLSNSNLTKLDLNIYPNPASDILNIEGDINDKSNILIYDINGKIINYDRLTLNQLEISQLPAGVYNLVMKKGTNSYSVPFTKI